MASRRMRTVKVVGWMLGILVVLFGLMQIIPYGRTHANPPTIAEPEWDSPRTRDLAKRACFDCHSNETRWPWYASVAPMSWMVQIDVDGARDTLNFSEWNRSFPLANYSGRTVHEQSMPPYKYERAHPEARLTAEERDALARGFDAMFGNPQDRPPAMAP